MGSLVRAIDLGFGHTKFTTVNASGELRYASFPSLALASVEPHTAREHELHLDYRSKVDPRLNYRQALEMAMLVTKRLRRGRGR